MTSPFFVSAPGKVILFGEHSAVYGKPALAAALSLRAYLLVTPSQDPNTISLEFPDIALSCKWNKNDIPWDEIENYKSSVNGKPKATDELVPEILDNLLDLLDDAESTHLITTRCFLYLYSILCHKTTPGCHFCIRSTLPIGAGLGSSASVSVCLSTALSVLGGHVSRPNLTINDRHHGKGTADTDFVDAWSLMGEKCFHGNPSGIDNAVATHGGAVLYQRLKGPGNPSVRTNLRNFPALDLLLTNTKIPRSTADLVGNVARINSTYPKIADYILSGMEQIATEAYATMLQLKVDKAKLSELMNLNHGLLVSLGVSHPALETIKAIGDTHKIGATKLTGAGGGGCAITLVSDKASDEQLAEAKSEFEERGFTSYKTQLGGKGVGVLFDADDKVFSAEAFVKYESRDVIEENIGTSFVPGWRFW